MPWQRALAVLSFVVVLQACTDPKTNPAWELAGEPGLLYEVKRYYEHHAVEEAGICTRPLLEGATGSRVVEDTEDELVVDLTYYYRDMVRDRGDDCGPLRPNRCFVMVPCRGFAQRTFTIDRTAEGPKVVGMSGPERATTLRP
jgi:hypothetical protein